MNSNQKLRELMPLILCLAVNVMFFAVLLSLLFRELPGSGKDVLLILLGALVGGWKEVLSYWIGSSSGSAEKSETIKNVIQNKKEA